MNLAIWLHPFKRRSFNWNWCRKKGSKFLNILAFCKMYGAPLPNISYVSPKIWSYTLMINTCFAKTTADIVIVRPMNYGTIKTTVQTANKTLKSMTDDPSSPSKNLVRETRTKNSVRMSCILARVFSHARNLFRVGHSSIPSKFLVRVSRTSFLDGELGSSVMGFRLLRRFVRRIIHCVSKKSMWLRLRR